MPTPNSSLVKLPRWASSEKTLERASLFVIAVSLLLALPALLVPLGLSAEGDAVDYRIPLVKWIVRHHALPNWPWTMVDDYPLLGEMMMAALSFVHPALARLVPLAGFAGAGAAGGALCALLGEGRSPLRARTLFLLGAAWTLALRPLALQSNLLMIDNLASAFLLGSLALVFRRQFAWAGLCAAGAMATRYSTWLTAAFLPFVVLALASRERRWRDAFVFCLCAGIGPLPFMIRNFLVNGGHAFYPIDVPEVLASVGVNNYGRGHDFASFLLFPYDLLYTNSFVKGFYDYTVGKLFYLQLLAFVLVAALRPRALSRPGRLGVLAAAFALVHFVSWFFTGQQLRFLVPSLVVGDLFLLLTLARAEIPVLLLVVTAAGVFSATSIQKGSILLALGRQESYFQERVYEARACFARAGVGHDVVGYDGRGGMLGFFDEDFYFTPEHTYGIKNRPLEAVPWLYTLKPRPGYVPWPADRPCLLKRVTARSGAKFGSYS